MERLLYYPSFEIHDERWLKFAMLYLGKVKTIVPHSAYDYLSSRHNMIAQNTNLLDKLIPEYHEGERAGDKAIELFRKLIDNRKQYWGRFGRIEYLEWWRNKQNHNFELFQEKYSYSFMDFCRNENLCTVSDNGVLIPEDLGLLYMSILAHCMKEQRNIDVITDSMRINRLKTLVDGEWNNNSTNQRIMAVKSLIELHVPAGLDRIPINRIIELRNRPSYQRKLKAFHSIVARKDDIESINTNNIHEINQELQYHVRDIGADVITNLGTGVVVFGLGTYTAITCDLLGMDLLREMVNVGYVVGGSIQLYHGLANINEKCMAKGYLTEIQRLEKRYYNTTRMPRNII